MCEKRASSDTPNRSPFSRSVLAAEAVHEFAEACWRGGLDVVEVKE